MVVSLALGPSNQSKPGRNCCVVMPRSASQFCFVNKELDFTALWPHKASYVNVILAALTAISLVEADIHSGARCEEELKEIEAWGSTMPGLKHPLSCLRTAQLKLLEKMLEIKIGIITPQELSEYVRPLAKDLFPDGIWPDHIEPIPRINNFCGDYYYKKKLGNCGLQYHLCGILCIEIRHCAEFVRLFMMVVYMMDMFLWSMRKASSSARSKMRREGIPTEKEMTIVHQGYAHELAPICVSLFGPDIPWSKAIVGLKEKAFNLPGSERARLRVKDFDAAQSKLLAWTKIEQKREIVLTDVSD
jgi:hypothetical protein